MRGTHDVELFFHCDADCRVAPIANGYAIGRGTRTLMLHLPGLDGASMHVYSGSVAPIAGWISRRFDERQPAPTICWRARIAGDAMLLTEIV